jgi:hypothetical protein
VSGFARAEPLRGEVWDAEMPRVGHHPVVVLTINPLLQRLSSTTAVLVTGKAGPRSTHVPLADLFAHRGRLSAGELRALEEAIRIAHGLVEAEL